MDGGLCPPHPQTKGLCPFVNPLKNTYGRTTMPLIWKEACKKKWIDPQDIEKRVTQLKKSGKTIATLNGSFDLLHAGHLHIIFEASKLADVLIVALNSDASVRGYKGEGKPLVPLQYRLQLISALGFVDYVTWFDELDPRAILGKICPDVHVNGAEYGENCIEKEVVVAGGGRLHLVERIDGLSTTDIIKKITVLCG